MKDYQRSFNNFKLAYFPFLVAAIGVKSADYKRNHFLFELKFSYLECTNVAKSLWEGNVYRGVAGNLRGAHS